MRHPDVSPLDEIPAKWCLSIVNRQCIQEKAFATPANVFKFKRLCIEIRKFWAIQRYEPFSFELVILVFSPSRERRTAKNTGVSFHGMRRG
ncbi:MAG: hypothetical protein Q9P90_10440 [candidate division KSB1 bacterium]|nr:hypothetical protein [candidate division KSB1 bacterium]